MGPSLRESAGDSAEGEGDTLGTGFYFSYAHTPPLRGDRLDPDYWAKRFFHELETEVRHLDPRLSGGYVDHRIPAGLDPLEYAARKLAECRVFVPLYSDGYFDSERCGREWSVFERRRRLRKARTGDEGRAVVPVLWTPAARDVPACARRLAPARLLEHDLYLDLGLYQLIRLHEHAYHEAVLRLAQLIVHRARVESPPAVPPAAYHDVEPAFPGQANPQRPLYVSVAAALGRAVPKDRDPAYYGASPQDWRPYHPRASEPLAERAARVARTAGYTARISVLTTFSPETRIPGPQREPAHRPQGPSILLADPWVFDGFASSRTALERVDRARRETVRLMVPWSDSDPETLRQRLFLESRVQNTVPWMFQSWRRSVPERLQDLTTAEQFDEALLLVIDLARDCFLSSSDPLRNAPFTRYSSRPRLLAPPSDSPP
ncbi:hypothetical protein KDL01_11730 [Actinospica durhamensis]|uniref:TIR domain-containing protein n=1 Tax=Actinospica durhamensis TaxID=1508375 RepID=A0A941IMA3_9ACTN|nr:TIR-like protein FxsC [Actinospica durhamensis]MBR7833940.1 hypothetical protein [Actinospica durhamensis]